MTLPLVERIRLAAGKLSDQFKEFVVLFLGHVRRELLARIGARQYFFLVGAQSLLDHRANVDEAALIFWPWKRAVADSVATSDIDSVGRCACSNDDPRHGKGCGQIACDLHRDQLQDESKHPRVYERPRIL